MSQAPAWELGMEYAGESRKDKLAALRKNVKELGADTFVFDLFGRSLLAAEYPGRRCGMLPGGAGGDLILTEDALVLYTDERKFSPELFGARWRKTALPCAPICSCIRIFVKFLETVASW